MDELTYNGKRFSEFDTFFDGSKAFGSPEKDYELVEVLGRNGSLSIYNDRFKDIQLPFPCFIRSNFTTRYRALTEYLNSQHGYQRLETSKEPNHYRKALFQGIVDPQTTPFNHGGFFTINFLCKPQRFLKTGDTPVSADASSETYTGNPVEIDNPSGLDTVTSLSVDINPVQDLHGYDSPWVGGAGKNKLNPNDAEIGTAWNGATNTARGRLVIPCEPSAQYTLSMNGSVTVSNVYCTDSASVPASSAGLDITARFPYTFTTASTSQYIIIAFTQTALTQAMVDGMKLMLEAGSTATTYEPYSNICPISGFDSVKVVRTGKNLLPYPHRNMSGTIVGVSFSTAEDGGVALNGTSSGVGYIWLYGSASSSIPYWFKPNTQYSIRSSDDTTKARAQVILYGSPVWTFNETNEKTFTSPQYLSGYTGFAVVIQLLSGKTFNNEVVYPQLEYGSTATSYEPYVSTTYPVSFSSAGAVYGGSVDVVSGVLTVTHAEADLGSLTWTYESASPRFYTSGLNSVVAKPATNNTLASAQSSAYALATFTDFYTANKKDGTFAISTTGAISIRDTRYTTAADFKTAVSGVQLVYELATPITYNLTPTEVTLLTGINYISADSGDVGVTVSEPAILENPTLFESKPLIRCYGSGTVNINDQYITISTHPYEYIDIDCELMDARYGLNNANQYVSFSTTDFITLQSGNNYIKHNITKVEVTPRWYEI